MSLIDRLRGLFGAAPIEAPAAADSRALNDFLRVIEVADATDTAGALFLKKFTHPIPDYPRHFIMQYEKSPGDVVTIGYVHYLAFEDCWLCGGMCVDGMAHATHAARASRTNSHRRQPC